MQALHLYYTQETIAKLERLAQLTANKRHMAFGYRLLALDWCALVVSSVNEASQLPLNGPEDLASFTTGLDHAAQAINNALDTYFQVAYDGRSYALDEMSHQGDGMSDIYLERRARIRAAGKEQLLARFSTKLANR